jgi:hypothetical protein
MHLRTRAERRAAHLTIIASVVVMGSVALANEDTALVPSGVRPAIKGVVIDSAGRGIAEARVDIATATPRVGRGMFCPSCYRDCAKWTETDQDGKFEITDLDPTLRFQVLFTAVGKAAHVTNHIDPLLGSLTIKLNDAPTNLPPEHTVRGLLVNEQGVPICGALVDPEGAKTADRRWWGRVDGVVATVSDRDGRFVMALPASFQGVDLEVAADGYAGVAVALVAPGEQEHRIVVPAGARVVGVLEYEGKPVAASRIAVVQVNRNAGKHFIKAVEAITDERGRFEFDHLPAAQPYVIFTPVMGNPTDLVLGTKKFMVPADGQMRDLGTLTAIPGLRLAGRIDAPEGLSLPPHAKLSLHRDPAWDLISLDVGPDGRFETNGLAPETYIVRLPFKEFVLDTERLTYQMTNGNQEFGIRITAPIDELLIPLQPTPAK